MTRPEWVDDLVASLTGTNRADILGGSTGNDTIDAARGDDTVAGEEGDDVIDGGAGNDVIYGDMGDGFDQGVDASPLVLDINNIESVSHDGFLGSAGDSAVFRDVATLPDGSTVWGRLILVEKDNPNLLVEFGYAEGAEILLDGDQSGDRATFRLEFFDPTTGDPVYLNSTATFNDVDDNRSGGHSDPEAVIVDGNSFTSFGVSSDSSLNTATDGNMVTATGTEANMYTDQDAWFSAQFEDRSSIEFTLQTRVGLSGFTLSGDLIDDAVVTVIEQGADTILGGDGDDVVYGQGGNDSLFGEEGNDSLDGGDGDDVMDGGVGNDTMMGGDGGDTIAGGEGDDYIEGGAGDDYLTTGIGNDTLLGGEGDDTLRNSAGDDSLVGGVGNDSIVATDGNDTLDGGDGNDTLYGGNHNDLLIGGAGDDLMFGEADADLFQMSDGFGNDTLTGGEAGIDFDKVDLTAVTTGVSVTYTGDEAGTITDGADTITFSEIEALDLTDQADVVDASADSAGVEINAGAGDDTIRMGAGDDVIYTGADYDQVVLTASGGVDTIKDFDLGDDDADTFYNDQLDVSELTGGSGPGGAVRTSDVSVSDDGFGNALLSFPGGEQLVLTGVAPGQITTHAQLFSAGIPCFTPDVRLTTDRGTVPAGQIQVGDMLQTADNGLQPVIWVGKRTLSPEELARRSHLRPYRLRPHSLLAPKRPMLLSPQHRLLVNSSTFERDVAFGESFVSAKMLSGLDPNCRQLVSPHRGVTYVHLMTERHEVVFAEGIATETFWPGPEAIRGLSPDNMRELFELFPALAKTQGMTAKAGRRKVLRTYGELARLPLKQRDLKHLHAA
ncbi:Hint domain-containing protein [Phaeobacter sp. QD34_3]|uniref:Hint domain-containing protein n=1 Tax=unclassified Phaeobacter TaxID=2621772 RepID=UPI00237FBAE9|nr:MULTISPECIES: Hint domain-containing protein [unclassified Phaeobacter]MDE4131877.1 Hint domain-containing protein [Phaeobacter sp. QD34_3]MDE4135515.1 Hint domain-containing protein [Phaeobacter sp. QD34_24]